MSKAMWCLSLCLLAVVSDAFAGPVTSPEIATKSSKTGTSPQYHHQHQPQPQPQYQHHHSTQIQPQRQQQLQSQHKMSPQDPHLNSLNAYAANYESIGSGGQGNFKPSYKQPDMENNFTPIQNGGGAAAPGGVVNPTPVLMQYIHQPVNEATNGAAGGVQYLQLIPTRPLIVPITSIASSVPFNQHLPVGNSLAEYVGRAPPVLTALAPNAAQQVPPTQLLDLNGNVPPYGIPTYAAGASLQPYRNGYRFNRDVRQSPSGLSLNLNEYLPGAHDAAPQPTYVRGRP